MKFFEIGQIWHSNADSTVQAKVIAVTDDGLHATLRRVHAWHGNIPTRSRHDSCRPSEMAVSCRSVIKYRYYGATISPAT